MLETLHLTKVYKTKGGANVRALDDVSIRFPEKGMVFLLGKSGSGKSTLLNVCGGLDSPTGGAIVVKGRSSNAFSQSDFDSYRNTFVGFIFQEYNILNEFSVEDNIALALELQGKPKDKKVIAELLEQVDLTGYAKRKPNTLSGGQKQRIAIARALVKSPEIIMADEPTGALDSATGKQVFDTLKKLSKDKLVIVVSHDREFAESYGDRIIELMDGKVISDVTKTEKEQEYINSNISVVGNTLCLKKGSHLSEADFAEIKSFLENSEADVIISGGEKEVAKYKAVNRIKDSGGQEIFEDSAAHMEESPQYKPEDSRFIRSKLPLKHAYRIGISSMKSKPIRLVFTILLCTVAFMFFGVLSTLTFYDSESTFKESVQASGYSMIKMGKVYNVKETWHSGDYVDSYDMKMETKFTDKELQTLREKYGKGTFGGTGVWYNVSTQSAASRYWSTEISSAAFMQEDNPIREKIEGTYPQKDDEICISSYMAKSLYHCKAIDAATEKIMELEKPEDIIGKKIMISGQKYTVTGIFDSGEIPAKFDAILDSDGTDYQLYSALEYELSDNLHKLILVTENQFNKLAEEDAFYYGMDEFSDQRLNATVKFNAESAYQFPEWGNVGYGSYEKYQDKGVYVPLGETMPTPGQKDTVISIDALCNFILGNENMQVDKELQELILEIENRGEDYKTEDGDVDFKNYTYEELIEKTKEVVAKLNSFGQPITVGARYFDDMEAMAVGENMEFNLVALWVPEKVNDYEVRMYFTESVADAMRTEHREFLSYYVDYETKYVVPADAKYGTIYIPYDHSEEQTDDLWKISSNDELEADDSKIVLTSALLSNLEMVDSLVLELSTVFLYVGVVLAVFAALLLSNFISVSISYKKREIGILRAVGARSIDVFKIFFSESFVITLICVVLALCGSLAICGAVNTELVALISASLFVFGPMSIGVLLAVALATSVIATFLPVWRAARKKPVESIRAL